MTTVEDVLQFINTIAPPAMAESWDNVGLLCGRKSRRVKKILVALDPFETVIREAVEEQADLILTHHPLIFGEGLTAVNEDTQTGRNLLTLMEHGIAAINAHTNLDMAPGGVNDCLAKALGLQDIQVIAPAGQDELGRDFGLLRQGTTEAQPLEAFLSRVKTALGCEGLRYVNGGKPVHRVAVGGGACAGELAEALDAGCDTFVTADVKYNQFRTAFELGVNLIDAGHFHTENPTMPLLAEKLQAAFPDVVVKYSGKHTDCMKFF